MFSMRVIELSSLILNVLNDSKPNYQDNENGYSYCDENINYIQKKII